MANIAECGVAIAKEDLKKLDGAITKVDVADGIEEVFAFEITKRLGEKEERHKVVRHHCYIFKGVGNSESQSYYEVDGKRMENDEYEKKYPYTEWNTDYDTHKVITDKAYSNGWCVDWKKLHSYSYEMDTYVQEYDDHITIFFGGRWGFPENLENLLDEKEVRWQGAEAESGCEVLNDKLGNEFFGLNCIREKDDEGYWNYMVEDRS